MSHLAHCIFRLVLASLALARHTNSIVRANVGEIRSSGDAPRQSSHTESGPGEGPSSLRELGRRRQRRTLRRSRMMGTPAAAKSEGEEEEGNGFPKVFSAIVLTPPPEMSGSAGGDVSGINQNRDAPGVNFLSEVDLMYYATAERDDDDVEAHGGTDVFFMVHSQRELDYLTSVADNTTTMGAFGSNSSSTRQRAAVDASSIRFNAHRTEELQTAAAAVRQGRSNARARVIEEEEEAGTGEEEVVPKYSTIPGHSCFRNLAGMHTFLQDLNSTTGVNSKPDLIVNVRDIGDSYLKTQDAQRGYDILAINITGNGVPVADHDDAATTTTTTKKGMFLALFGSHAREYAPPELGARFAEMLIGGYGTDADITSILDRTEVHLILHVNPDGREIAEGGVFQRKNMHDYSEIKTCDEEDIGVDLNRNFPFKWGLDSGSSSNPCSAGYRGPYAASEPETRAVMDYALAIFPEGQRKVGGDDLALNEAYDEISTSGVFFDVHAHGGLNLYPFSFEERLPPNGDGLRTIARKLRRYNGHRIIDFWYEASGTTGDWAYAALGAATQIFEIGDEDFQDCETFEHDIASGNLEALLYATRLARAPYSIAKGLDVIDVALSSTSIDIVEVGSFLTVSVDVEGSSSSSKMGGQSTFVVKLFVDMHPYDRRVVSGSLRPEQPADNATTVYSSWERQAGVEMKLTTGDAGKTQTANFSMSYFQLLSLLGPPTVAGRHVLHLQGTDNDTGNPGPVKSVYFDVYNSTSEGSLREWTVLTSDHFEFGWGNWSDGGKYARRYVGANYKNGGYAHTGTTAIEVRGDFGTDSSVVHKHNLDVRSFVHLRMTFSFCVRRFDNKDEFFLDLSNDGGESWGTVKSWRHEEDIESDRMYKDEVVVMNSTVYDFSDSLRLRFRSDASSKEESVYIDDVELAGRR